MSVQLIAVDPSEWDNNGADPDASYYTISQQFQTEAAAESYAANWDENTVFVLPDNSERHFTEQDILFWKKLLGAIVWGIIMSVGLP